jgi:hypothetical protein
LLSQPSQQGKKPLLEAFFVYSRFLPYSFLKL